VVVVPGPAAAITALTGSGLPAARFCFEGFLPRGGPPRRARIEALADEERTTVLYESPHRLAATLGDLAAVVGADRRVVIARELTKLHEEWWRGTVADATGWASAAPVRGEVVIVLDGAPPPAPPGPDELAAAVHAELDAGRSVRDLSASLARRFGVPRKQVYGLAVAWTAESGQRRPPR
jgi:16S rRNA (cytidine1402-2'-O)-methyltransferase